MDQEPVVLDHWQKEFFENGAAAFEQKARPNYSAEQQRISYLEKIQTKDSQEFIRISGMTHVRTSPSYRN